MKTASLSALRADPAFAPLRRSLDVYYGDPARDAAMDGLYARFVKPGDLAFDIGAHIGDRTGSFRRLSACVVALEPQPLCVRAMRALYGDAGRLLLAPNEPQGLAVTLHVPVDGTDDERDHA